MSLSTSKSNERLSNCKKSIELYLRALWAKGIYLQSCDEELFSRVLLTAAQISLPSRLDQLNNLHSQYTRLHFYRAAAVHASLHIIYKSRQYEVADINLLQRVVIGLVEDLRIEQIAMNHFPGLRKLWLSFHQPVDSQMSSTTGLLARLSKSVLDKNYIDESAWVNKGRSLILGNKKLFADSAQSHVIGMMLANDLGQMRMPLNSGKYEPVIAYRDDNSCLWLEVKEQRDQSSSTQGDVETDLHYKKLQEREQGAEYNFTELETVNSDGSLLNQAAEGLEYLRHISSQEEQVISYAEWDYRTHIYRQDWCKLKHEKARYVDNRLIDTLLSEQKNVLMRMRKIARKMQMLRRQRRTRLEEGDELDMDLVISSMVAMRSGAQPDERVFMRNDFRHDKSLSISILLDLSESTNNAVSGTAMSVSELMRNSVLLLAEALDAASEEFAIAGFCSNGRKQVNYTQYKDFIEPYEETSGRLAGIRGEYSTRLGAAIRHAGAGLESRDSMKKILLVITDGAPSDIDVYDEKYLEYDSWHAVKELRGKNIKPYCINLDSRASQTIEHVFGKASYQTLENINYLPNVLSAFYMRYARH